MASEKSPKLPQSSRLPAPSLFVGPPSRNASNTSLLPPNPIASPTGKPQLARQRSHLSETHRVTEGADAANGAGPTSAASPRRTRGLEKTVERLSIERTEAIWAEMQNTLEEVDLSATNPPQIFSSNHAKALDDLRTAQIALAQAWARSETEEAKEEKKEDSAAAVAASQDKTLRAASLLAADRVDKLGDLGAAAARPRSGSMKSNASDRTQLEEDTEKDIQLARKRREANDRYFQRVNQGVLEVVAKLDEVAKSMKIVEQDSKEIWGDNDTITTASTVP
jgi:hypothetical protein